MHTFKLFQASTKLFSTSSRNNFKFVQFTHNSDPCNIRVGYIDGNGVVDLNKFDSGIPNTMLEILRCQCLPAIYDIPQKDPPIIPLECVNLEVPIHNVDKIIGAINNYEDFCNQKRIKKPEFPIFFSKFASTLTGHNSPIFLRSRVTECVDWEVELCVVIGCAATNVSVYEADNIIMGYTIAQDITARDWSGKANGGHATLAKNMDAFTPIGPWIVTKDEIGDVNNLRIKCRVNGICKQDSCTCNMIHKIPSMIERLSSLMTLYPGDLILTGTPSGIGESSSPPQYLEPGDCLLSEIDCIGVLCNNICSYW